MYFLLCKLLKFSYLVVGFSFGRAQQVAEKACMGPARPALAYSYNTEYILVSHLTRPNKFLIRSGEQHYIAIYIYI